MQAKFLNYDLAPKPVIVFSCLLPAPFLSALVGYLFMLADHSALPARFAPLSLSVTHGLVLAGLMPIMLGALFQLFAVVGGQNLTGARYLSPLIAPGCAALASLLSLGFYGQTQAFTYALILAVSLFGPILIALLVTGWRIAIVDASTRMLAYSGWALASVLASALVLLGILQAKLSLDLVYWLRLHQSAGLLAWLLALILAIASTVFPMFWQSPRPSARWQASMPQALWLALLLLVIPGDSVSYLLALAIGILALLCLNYVWRAKRRFDPAWPLWLCAALSVLTGSLLLLLELPLQRYAADYLPRYQQALPWWLGVLALLGLAYSCVIAMLGKIIPFLVFLHLRKQIAPPQAIPVMQQILRPRYLKWLSYSHISSLLILLAVPFAPDYAASLGAAIFSTSQFILAMLLINCLWRYRQVLRAAVLARSTTSTMTS